MSEPIFLTLEDIFFRKPILTTLIRKAGMMGMLFQTSAGDYVETRSMMFVKRALLTYKHVLIN